MVIRKECIWKYESQSATCDELLPT